MAVAQVIKYEGDNTMFVWKHPTEDFYTTTQLIVHETQEALFYMNGQALDLFGPGRHTLETQNIPLIKKLINLPTGSETPFHAEVYFINKTEQMAIKWGTDSQVQFLEPTYQFPLNIGASGEMSLKVGDARRLLLKIVGTEMALSQEKLTRYLRSFLMARVKAYLAQTIKDKQINIFEIDEHLNTLSDDLRLRIATDYVDYGVLLETFFVTTIVKPDGDKNYEKFKELHFRKYADVADAEIRQNVGVIDQATQARRTVIEAQGISQKRTIEGYTYQQERGFDVAEKVAQNEGAGTFSSTGIGLGMMTGIGGPVGAAVSGVFSEAIKPIDVKPISPDLGQGSGETPAAKPGPASAPVVFCDNCGSALAEGSAFCEECGTPVAARPSCAKCGFIFERPGKFCPRCGNNREEG
jgi:membrane protease subunit (stomatin/prohibitin family)